MNISDAVRSARALQCQASSLLLYQSVVREEVGLAFFKLLQALANERDNLALEAYGTWFRMLASTGKNWQEYLLDRIIEDENPFSDEARQGKKPSPSFIAAVQHDLRVLQKLYNCDGKQIARWLQIVCALPDEPPTWQEQKSEDLLPIVKELKRSANWEEVWPDLVRHYQKFGTGIFARYHTFRWEKETLQGIDRPDPIRLSDIVGYDRPKRILIENVRFLLAGYRALHVLLYGSRGSGKSSLIKALANEYGDRGLRLVEVAKSHLHQLPEIVRQLWQRPQKFILFVDDLSFEEDDDTFKALKVVLEGNVIARPDNVIVCATSNRRHLVREFFADRPRPSDADEVQAWDTVQEKLSFSDRFGLTLTFEPASQETYLEIVRHLAARSQLDIATKELERQALQWATQHNGRSGRTARQFVDFLTARLNCS